MTTYREQLHELIESLKNNPQVTIQVSVSKSLLDCLDDEIPGTSFSWETRPYRVGPWPRSLEHFMSDNTELFK